MEENKKTVHEFNEMFNMGDKIGWRPSERMEFRTVTISSNAFLSNSGEPVVFFEEISGYCSISSKYVQQSF